MISNRPVRWPSRSYTIQADCRRRMAVLPWPGWSARWSDPAPWASVRSHQPGASRSPRDVGTALRPGVGLVLVAISGCSALLISTPGRVVCATAEHYRRSPRYSPVSTCAAILKRFQILVSLGTGHVLLPFSCGSLGRRTAPRYGSSGVRQTGLRVSRALGRTPLILAAAAASDFVVVTHCMIAGRLLQAETRTGPSQSVITQVKT